MTTTKTTFKEAPLKTKAIIAANLFVSVYAGVSISLDVKNILQNPQTAVLHRDVNGDMKEDLLTYKYSWAYDFDVQTVLIAQPNNTYRTLEAELQAVRDTSHVAADEYEDHINNLIGNIVLTR